jgi:GNAT superfamily N-acetyltransferase
MAIQTTSSSNPTPQVSSSSKETILILPASLHQASTLGRIAAQTYYNDALNTFLAPHRALYPSHYERGFILRSWRRMLDPRNLTFVAVSSSNPSVLMGYAQFVRLGDDEGAKRQIASRASLFLTLAGWLFWLYSLVLGWVVGVDKSCDLERLDAFEAEAKGVDKEHWDLEGRRERWHVQSIVVREEWQGKGIGKILMAEVIARAEGEGVVVGLEASEKGERLYRRVGFELLGRFNINFGEERMWELGGIMMYTPKRLRRAKS